MILRSRSGKEADQINLHNMYRTYLEQPRARRADCLRALARGMLSARKELPDEFDAASHDLRPKIWARAGLEHARLHARLGKSGASASDLLCEPLGDHLLLFLAYDWPESTQSLSQTNLDAWGVTFYEAMEAARRNLEETTKGYASIGDNNVYVFRSCDSYDAARLSLTERIADLELAGKPVAMVPNRDSLLITGSDDPAGLQIMADIAQKGLAEKYTLSGIPLILEDGAWTDWMPPQDHPVWRRFRDIEVQFVGSLYAEQKKLLDAIHQRDETDIFVASYSAMAKNDSAPISYCVWSRDVDSLLPVTQKIAFCDPNAELKTSFGDWSKAAEILSELMEPTDDYPPRFRVREFPSAEALKKIGLGPP